MNSYMNFWDKIFNFFGGIWDSFYQSVIYDNRYEFIFEGLLNTIIIAIGAAIIGIVIGIVSALIRNNHDMNGKMKIGNKLSKWYVDIIRGTPSILQLMIIYYVIFKSVNINIVIVGILAFGINSVDKGQFEAGYGLGLSYGKVMRYIILPQAFKNILPAMGNEFITLVKETAVGAYIGIVELTKASDIIASRTYDYFFPLIIIAIIYFAITLSLTKLFSRIERRLNNVRS